MKKLFSLVMVIAMLAAFVPVAAAAPPEQEGQEYIISLGDWLSKIAEKYLGNVMAYPLIQVSGFTNDRCIAFERRHWQHAMAPRSFRRRCRNMHCRHVRIFSQSQKMPQPW